MIKNLLFVSHWFSKFLHPMKILITSDNHLGFKENDDIRGNDSFNTFEEILMIARQENVDFIIQGGDLFHDNRPSRYCIDRTVQLLNKYCTGRTKSKHKELMRLNKMSQNVLISIPIVAIHGNHDDPSGINRISTLNILHSAGLINYIGQYTADKIVIDPILVENVAIYGIGHIKDKLLYTSLIEGKVVFNKPNTQKKYYSILILHQNRVPRNKEHIPESLFDDKFDLIIYGHDMVPAR
ncbi:double-strand break dna repair protein, partial [Nosema bombycis CQ1]